MKKILAVLLVLVMVLSLCACTVSTGGKKTEITLWTYPIGNWGDQATVDALIADFEKANPDIKVKVEFIDYQNGDDKVNTAIEGNAAPDLIMEGPERLVANWGAKGLMVDLSDMIDDTDKSELNAAALNACYGDDGKVYEYPLVMTAHCMAINVNVFEAAGAMEHIDAEAHTWKSTEDFFAAVDKVYAYTGKDVGTIYCGGQGGDQGTRALVTNLNGGTYTNAEHTEYTWNSPENIAALERIVACEGISFNPGIVAADEIAMFYNETLSMAFCWNIAQQLNPNSANTGAEKTLNGNDILFLAFPSDTTPALQGGIWGFGIFDNGDDAKIKAAKTFIKYMCDSAATADAVKAANYFAARTAAEGTDLSGIWADNAVMNEYNVLMPFLGDYYQVTTNWASARTAWWNMLQEVGAGKDIQEAIEYWIGQIGA
ncbi:MAG: extracellular solute-binding protein [Oscillospiraceae bacterium]|nr:extracellular solute-binding protein [Oscillospiraceae bacterium]